MAVLVHLKMKWMIGKSTALIRDRLFSHQFNFELIFHSLVNRDDSLLRKVIIAFIDLTVRLTNQ